ncbi:MAG: hypothetical protein LDL29_01300 [Dechloromonas sp.]|nr:hypothetical protein [Dechloromonas sp.]
MKKMIAKVLAAVALLTGCAQPPRVGDSKVLALPESRIEQLIVVYRDLKLRTASSYRFGSTLGPSNAPADTGFDEFGKVLVGEVEAVFAGRQVAVQKVLLLLESQPLPLDAAVPILVLAPVGGRIHSSTMSTAATYTFTAQLLDPVRRQVLWQGKVDTNTWIGQDFVMKNFEKTTYDAVLARKFLQVIATKLSEDGLIR